MFHQDEVSPSDLAAILQDGELPTELLVLAELTGEIEHLQRWAHHITGPAPWEHSFPLDVAETVREQLVEVLANPPSGEPDETFVRQLATWCAGPSTARAQEDMLLKEMGLTNEDEVCWSGLRPADTRDFHVVIIGAGISGIAAARRLERLGIPYTVLEAAEAVGGTWLLNSYPGCGVDIASHYFSFSFAQNPGWSRFYAKQPEILGYLQEVAREAGILDHVRLNCPVSAARYDSTAQRWTVTATDPDGRRFDLVGDVVISATGLLGVPHVPDYEGLDGFTGALVHSAEWDDRIELAGRRVALVGSGASANQIGPTVAPVAADLTVYQRSAHWNVGVENYSSAVSDGEQWLLEHVPAYARWFRARTLLSQNDVNRSAQVVDPDWAARHTSISAENERMRKVLTDYIRDELGERQDLLPLSVPDYPPFSKRILRDNGWYRMLRRGNVELVPGGDLRFDGTDIIGPDGVRRTTDVCILATGFRASRMLASYEVIGRDGRCIREEWGEDDPRAHLGMTVPGFPNFFVMYGPNTNIGTGGSIIFQAETWSHYIVEAIKTMVERKWAELEVRRDAMELYNRRLDERLAEMVWSVTSASTWYRNSQGRVTTNMPWTTFEYWDMTRRVDFSDFEITQRRPQQRSA